MLSTGILAAVATMTCVDPTGGAQSCVADWDDANPMIIRWN
jgi:hypothetical protein